MSTENYKANAYAILECGILLVSLKKTLIQNEPLRLMLEEYGFDNYVHQLAFFNRLEDPVDEIYNCIVQEVGVRDDSTYGDLTELIEVDINNWYWFLKSLPGFDDYFWEMEIVQLEFDRNRLLLYATNILT